MTLATEGTWDRVIRVLVAPCARVCRVGDLARNDQHRLARVWSDRPYALVTGLAGWCPAYAIFRLDQEESRRVTLTQVA